jgi:Fe-S cluster assembly scaffold protein SufB
VGRALSPAAREAGVIVDSFANVLRADPKLLERFLPGAPSLPETDRIGQLARGLWTVGALIYVPAGVRVDAPIVVRWDVGAASRGVVGRTLVVLEDGAHASVLEEQASSTLAADGGQSLWWGTLEVRLAPGATLDVAGLQEFGPQTVMLVNRHATLERDASLRWALASVGGLVQKSRIDNVLQGRGATVHQAEIAFGSGQQLFDLTSYTRHIAEDTTGDLLSKGVFLDRARGYFKGLIEIKRSARGTDSFLGEFAMLLAKRARSVAIPSLEIDQPDVRRASHASSVAPIDETQLFYLQSRGLDLDTARRFIVLGFLEPVVARIPLPDAQDRLRASLDRKWAPAAITRAA